MLTSETRLLTTRELAERLAVTESAVKKWVWLRRIPVIHIGRCIRFNLDEVLAHFRDRQGQDQSRIASQS